METPSPELVLQRRSPMAPGKPPGFIPRKCTEQQQMGKLHARFTSRLFMRLGPAQGGDVIEEGRWPSNKRQQLTESQGSSSCKAAGCSLQHDRSSPQQDDPGQDPGEGSTPWRRQRTEPRPGRTLRDGSPQHRTHEWVGDAIPSWYFGFLVMFSS